MAKAKTTRKRAPRKQQADVRRPAAAAKPKARRYVPPDCTRCIGDRKRVAEQENKQVQVFTECYRGPTRDPLGVKRYIRCRFCGNTWTARE